MRFFDKHLQHRKKARLRFAEQEVFEEHRHRNEGDHFTIERSGSFDGCGAFARERVALEPAFGSEQAQRDVEISPIRARVFDLFGFEYAPIVQCAHNGCKHHAAQVREDDGANGCLVHAHSRPSNKSRPFTSARIL